MTTPTLSTPHKDRGIKRCMVCGRPYAEHTPEERASGCRKEDVLMDGAARSERTAAGRTK